MNKKYAGESENTLDRDFWSQLWQKNETGWDIGQASPAIIQYMSQYPNKNKAILIPGCGNAHEAEFLVAAGFTNITLIDIAAEAVESLKEKFSDRPQVKILCEDFFEHAGNYDLIIEQTFFSAIPPGRRKEYAKKMASILHQDGKLIGVLFNKKMDQPLPPFGGSPDIYKAIFEPYFNIKTMDECYNSVPRRSQAELFIIFLRK